jgi:hypothetical protein
VTDFHGFVGAAKRLDDIDLPRIGHQIGVGEDEIHAFMDVESAGHGFDPQSNRPIILCEPHVFYRNLPIAKRANAVKAGLAYPKWGTKPYPKTQELRYVWLGKAMALDETAALKACSWGLTQILGENHHAAGYDTAQDFVLALMEDEENHLEATVKVLVSMHVDDDLRAHRWAVVARAWNGAGYAANKYDTKLAAAFAKWQRIKDTPFTLDMVRNPAARPTAPVPAPQKAAQPGRALTLVETPAMPSTPFPGLPAGPLGLGGILAGLTGPVGQAVQMLVPALEKAAANQNAPVEPGQASAVIGAAVQEIQSTPEFQHLTNTETAWYQQRSKWAAIIGTATAVAVPLLKSFGVNLNITPELADALSNVLAVIGSAVAAYLAYRAGTAKTPLFASKPDTNTVLLQQIQALQAQVAAMQQAKQAA